MSIRSQEGQKYNLLLDKIETVNCNTVRGSILMTTLSKSCNFDRVWLLVLFPCQHPKTLKQLKFLPCSLHTCAQARSKRYKIAKLDS